MARERATISIDFGDETKDFNMLEKMDEFIHLKGWNRKQAYLRGMAELMAKEGDNPELLIDLVNYIATRKRRK